jgi:hypothetical protein
MIPINRNNKSKRNIKSINDLTIQEIGKIKQKIKSYKLQDLKKGRLTKIDYHGIVSYIQPRLKFHDFINILIRDGLTCYLCNQPVKIIPPHPHYGKQLTLDRKDNNQTHNFDNCKVCCLTCNKLKSNKYNQIEFMNFFS